MICSKIYKVLMVIMTVVVMAGCTADEYLNDITPKTADGAQPKEPLSDDVSKALVAAGFGDVRIEDLKIPTGEDEEVTRRYYFFTIEQPVSHHNKSLGTYKQHACLQPQKDLTAPVLLYTHGYNMGDSAKHVGMDHIAAYLKASELHVEHRYFGRSLPEAYESLAFTYFNADEAAHDLDSVLVRLQRTVLKDSKKWVSTGVSKDGMTTALLAYYADQYGWSKAGRSDHFRMDLYIPFCAPFLKGTPESCDDPEIGKYLYNESGKGYGAGSDEEKAYQRLRKIPVAMVTDQVLREACLRQFHQFNASGYLELIDKFRDKDVKAKEERVSCAMVSTYFNHLFGKFSYLPFKEWAHIVPDVETATMDATTDKQKAAKALAINHVAEFVYMNEKALSDSLNRESLHNALLSSKSTMQQPATLSDSEIIDFLYRDSDNPYYIQAVKELGNIRFDFSMLDDVKFSPESTEDLGYLAPTISRMFETSTTLKKYASQWDGGRLMTNVRNWAQNSCTSKVLFVYAKNDPWTGGSPWWNNGTMGSPTLENVRQLVLQNTVHNNFIYIERYFSPTEKLMLTSAIDVLLK